jgi:hypothetical protein
MMRADMALLSKCVRPIDVNGSPTQSQTRASAGAVRAAV